MATRALAVELTTMFSASSGQPVSIQSAGGVEVAKRIRAGERFDVVLLAEDVLGVLAGESLLQTGSLKAFADSEVVVGVREGNAVPNIRSEAGLRAAVMAAARIGYSTGPSGQAVLQRFEAWGVLGELRSRLRQAPAGIPVAKLLAEGEVDLGFQQRSELQGAQGVSIAGALPKEVAVTTRFGAALGVQAASGALELLDYLCAPSTEDIKQRHGMAQPK